MGKPSRDKGKRGERELAKELTRLFGIECRRGVQYQGGPDSPDIAGMPGVHWECKHVQAFQLRRSLAQAVDECGEAIPVVAQRGNREEWVAVVRLEDLPALAVKIYHIMAANQ